jgi:hypothetical protein
MNYMVDSDVPKPTYRFQNRRRGGAGPQSTRERSKDIRRGKRQLDDDEPEEDFRSAFYDSNQDDDDESEIVSTVLAKNRLYG